MKKIFLILFSAIAMVLSSCGSCKKVTAGSSSDILGDWTIETAMNKSTKGGEEPATISFGKDGRVNGCATVNRFFGDYTNKNGKLTFSTVGMTRMMGQSMDIERAVCEALDKTCTVKVDGNTATVSDKDGNTVMVLKRK